MTYLHEVFDLELLQQMVNDGYVRAQTHPNLPYVIYNYTEKAQYERVWNDVTRQCRGLIADAATYEVIARPFRKFHNLGETGAEAIDEDEPVSVTDKMDGSLGILYPIGDGDYAVATRGSFTSEQALHATEVYNTRYGGVVPPWGWTWLFEIIYPENRIVLNYGAQDDLVMLGAVNITDGSSVPAHTTTWTGPVTQFFDYDSLSEALAAEPRANAEGLVVHGLESDNRLKIKQEDYVRLHRLVTNMTARKLWEFLAVKATQSSAILGKNEKSYTDYAVRRLRMSPDRVNEIVNAPDDWEDAIIASVPEEFEAWVRARVREINDAVDADRLSLHKKFFYACRPFLDSDIDSGPGRGQFVRHIRTAYPDDWQLLMTMLDNFPIEAEIWKRHYPAAERSFMNLSEDVA